MRRWLGLAAALVVAALVVWAVSGDWAPTGHHPSGARPPGDSGPPDGTDLPPPIVGGYNAAANNVVSPSAKTGGTLRLLAGSDCDSWDPGRTSLGWCWNLQRLITRTLVGYRVVDGYQYRLAPDLATSLGRHNADYTRWTYTLKPGLTYANGAPIRPIDIKYGIERLFAANLIPGDARRQIVASIAHPHPYQVSRKIGDVAAIRAAKNSIAFDLSAPNPDFDHLMAMPASAPVPYGRHWVASGPFKIRSDRPHRSVVFVRNRHWDQSTDTIRHPLVDSVRLRIDDNGDNIDRLLQAGRVDARADYGVQDRFRAKILRSPRLKRHADDPVVSDSTRYLAISPAVIRNVHCRRAIFYAADKQAVFRVFGGPYAAVTARSMTPPGLIGFEPSYDPYPSGPDGRGELVKAKEELQACGKPNGFSTKFAYGVPTETGPNLYRAEEKALGRVGIKFTFEALPSTYYCTNSAPEFLAHDGVGLVATTLRAAFPTGDGYYRQTPFNRRFPCLQNEDTDVKRLHDPIINRALRAAARGQATVTDWTALDRALMATATDLPLVWTKTLYYRNPRMTNVTCDNAIANGIYDFVNVGVR